MSASQPDEINPAATGTRNLHDAEDEKVIEADQSEPQVDWTPQELRGARQRFDFMVLPLLMLGFFSQQIDRSNIGPALTSGMQQYLGIDQNIVNNGQTILYISITVCEIPSNLVLQRIGARWWLPCQMTAWGIVAVLHSQVRDYKGFYLIRCALGILESGFIPGSVYYMSTFYTKAEFTPALFWIGSYVGKATGPLLASGIFAMGNRHGYEGWQWLFIIEGVMSIFIGIIALVWWPRSPQDTRTLIPGFSLLTKRQEYVLSNAIILDDPAKQKSEKLKISPRQVFSAMAQWRIWILLAFDICVVAPLVCLETYNAQITTSFGFSRVKGNALASVGLWASLPIIFCAGWAADKMQRRGVIALGFCCIWVIFTGTFYALTARGTTSQWSRYGLYQSIVAIQSTPYILGVSWVACNARTPTQRSIYSALYIMFTNVAGAFGGQMFRKDDKPKYLRGLKALMGLQSMSCLCIIAAILVFTWSNKKNAGDAGKLVVSKEAEVGEAPDAVVRERVTATKVFRYAL